MLKTLFKTFALTSVLAVAPLAASAFVVTYQNSNDVFGTNGRAGVTLHSTVNPNQGTRAGGFALSGDLSGNGPPLENFTAWCLDLATYIYDNRNYEISTTPFSLGPNALVLTAGQIANIGSLFNTGLNTLTLTNNAHSAGFQLALWEIAYETQLPGGLNLGTGNFSASNSAAAIAVANTLLGNLTNDTVGTAWNLTFLQADPHRSQNVLTATPVPLPAAGVLLLAALAGLGFARRRKAA